MNGIKFECQLGKTGHFEDVLPIKSVKKRIEEINLTKNNQGCTNKQNICKNLQSGLAASYNVQSCVFVNFNMEK